MLQLTYISTAALLTAEDEVERILRSARRNNAAREVTGLLLYDGRRFLQTLEGPTSAVSETYFRIKADKRHRAIVHLSSTEIDERAFGGWSMAAQHISFEGSVVEQIDKLTEHVKDLSLRASFRSFVALRTAA